MTEPGEKDLAAAFEVVGRGVAFPPPPDLDPNISYASEGRKMKWKLTVTVDAADENDAAMKLVDKIPFMLVNHVAQHGSAELALEPFDPLSDPSEASRAQPRKP